MNAPAQPTPPLAQRIIVGCDGSDAGMPALVWALAEARLRNVPLRVVTAWHSPAMAYTGVALYVLNYDEITAEVMASTKAMQLAAVQRAGIDPTAVELVIASGRPAQVLLDASRDASLIVVGARGEGVWGRLLLGSTSTEVVHHARTPVAVIPWIVDGESH